MRAILTLLCTYEPKSIKKQLNLTGDASTPSSDASLHLITFQEPQGCLSKGQWAHAINISFRGICTSLHQDLSNLRIALQDCVVQRRPK
mmetsp:Transcript_13068/g.28781  ORF Transcript_13068/g.28781 Transcript_13068/m.28781 type:complete len:89 (-) Transcript_13068:86-352(-)